ncbi:MAG: S26 family signal peptidase [Deferribacteraceae bacterium]|jgi:type IV secretory pathway protease TraF|nr:S26 family signal peptidase [Deferribacteraceae bacterium]
MLHNRSRLILSIKLVFTGLLIISILFVILIQRSADVSLPYHIWFRLPYKNAYTAGDYITFRYNNKLLLKKIICTSGSVLEKVNGCFYCDKILLNCAKTYDKKGNPTPVFTHSGVIPANHYFVTGEHPDSFDSRYIGLITKKQILSAVKPLM